MRYYQDYKLKNSFHLYSVISEIWFPENYCELEHLKIKYPHVSVIADGTNIIFRPIIQKLICLREMPSWVYSVNDDKEVRVLVSSNFKLHKLVQHSIDNNYTGLEGLYGIPGTVGGAIVGNSGSGEYAISNYLQGITVLKDNRLIPVYKHELNFKRRYSILKDSDYIVTNARFCFPNKKINKDELDKAKQHRNNFPKYPSVGGIFLNWHDMKPYENQLIGLNVNDAEVSSMINIIINKGNATYMDVMNLIYLIRQIVKKQLELEVKII